MLAYLSWHRAAADVDQERYEQALERFHRSLAHRPPSGFHGSATVRLPEVPWLAPIERAETRPGYEDWYLIDDWTAVGVLEEAAVSRGHLTAHADAASRAGATTGAIYRLVEGQPLLTAPRAAWVTRSPSYGHPSLGALLGDGMDPQRDGLWRRCIGLGPAPEYCLLSAWSPPGIDPERLPKGWTVQRLQREAIWSG